MRELHDIQIYSQSPYATVVVDGKKIDGLYSVNFSARAGYPCVVSLELAADHVAIKGKAAVETTGPEDDE